MDELLTRITDFDRRVSRNVVGLRTSQDLFDDLTDGDAGLSYTAAALEAQVKGELAPPDQLSRAFLYATAVEYPFRTEPWHQSRYSDGTFPVWYASLDKDTTIAETGYHMARHELAVEGVNEVVVRERAVYTVHCRALLIDLSDAGERHPELVHDHDYGYTQALGRRISHEGHPGLLAPSARHRGGINTVIFRQAVLSAPKLACYLRYLFDPRTGELVVERSPGKVYQRLWFEGL
ncbi:RES family NAD+ phosphorylase [Aquisalimonas sp.]|uniref:RES family NAD+ phosphorylase n=1 Tax=unclassified Aquisalimonas TaxID=2644645 RepID=UPI0025C230AC|nr:RES family NAD+ phosphorylase [Aquisalimonas sp.]